MPQIQGVAGVFIHAENPTRLAEWYTAQFGIAFVSDLPDTYYTEFFYRDDADPSRRWSTVFAIMPALSPPRSRGEYTIDYRVDDLRALVDELRSHGVIVEPVQEEGDGRFPGSTGLFTRLRDGEGNRIELYQPL